MSVTLRPYQAEACDRVRDELRSGRRRVLICAPTGAGKTVIASSFMRTAYQRGTRSLFVAHRTEILEQTLRKLVEMGIPEHEIGMIRANDPRRRPNARVFVGSIDTLRNRPLPPDLGLVFVDECHRALAKSYALLAARLAPECVQLGLTATPIRLDGQGMCDAYDEIVIVARVSDLVTAGYLSAPRVWSVPEGSLPDMSGVKSTGGDYNAKQLSERVNLGGLVGDIVAHWQKRAEGRRTVVFAASVEHSKAIVERFDAAGIAAEHLDGETDEEVRAAILARLASGATRVVSNVAVLTEGWDMPSVKCAILARPTQSLSMYLQQAGRILRPWEGVEPLILDHAGVGRLFGLPQKDREWSLEPAVEKGGKRKKVDDCAKVCPECCSVVDLGVMLCACGYEWKSRERKELGEADGELVELLETSVLRHTQFDDEVRAWRADNARRMASGKPPKKPGSLHFTWRNKYGCEVPRGCKFPRFTSEEQAAHDAANAKRGTKATVTVAPLTAAQIEAELEVSRQHVRDRLQPPQLVYGDAPRVEVVL